MKIWKQNLLIIMLLVGLNSSCNLAAPARTAPIPSIATVPPTAVPQAALTPTATNLSFSQMDFSCWPIKPLQAGNDIQGSFVYANYADPHTAQVNGLFAWDIGSFHSSAQTGNYIAKSGEQSYVSPDGTVIVDLTSTGLMLISQAETRSFNLPDKNLSINGYFTDGRVLLINRTDRKNNYKAGIGLTDTYYIFDSVKGSTTKHTAFLPDFQTGKRNSFSIQYSPNLKYVLYRSTSDDANGTFSLYDLEKSEIAWVRPTSDMDLQNSADSVPGWQPNIELLTALYFDKNAHTPNNYYSISLNGKVLPFTNFDGIELTNTTQPSPSSWSSTAESPNWSPDGRYLISAGSQKGDRLLDSFLYIWDNQLKIGYKPCLPNEEQRILPHNIIWSPDGFYSEVTLTFAPPAGASPSEYISKSYILDLANRTIFEIPDDSNRGEFTSAYKKGFTVFLGWVAWEIP